MTTEQLAALRVLEQLANHRGGFASWVGPSDGLSFYPSAATPSLYMCEAEAELRQRLSTLPVGVLQEMLVALAFPAAVKPASPGTEGT